MGWVLIRFRVSRGGVTFGDGARVCRPVKRTLAAVGRNAA
jgi:hypothetical protein